MKSFGQKSWMLPQPVLIIGTYDKNGKPNATNAAWGGQWDAKEIMIAMGAHATTDNLNAAQILLWHLLQSRPWWLLISWALSQPRTMQTRWRKQVGNARSQSMSTLPSSPTFP